MTEESTSPPPATAPDPGPDAAVIRRAATDRLIGHFDSVGALLARCETMAAAPKGGGTAPIFAAARLMSASADVTRALMLAARAKSGDR